MYEVVHKSPVPKSPLTPRSSSVILSGLVATVRSSSKVDARTLSPVQSSSRERENNLFGMVIVDTDESIIIKPKKKRGGSGSTYLSIHADPLSRSRSDKDARPPRLPSCLEDPNSQSSPAIFTQMLHPVSSDSTGTMNTCCSNGSMSSMSQSPHVTPAPRPVPETILPEEASVESTRETQRRLSPIRQAGPTSVQTEVYEIFQHAWPSSASAFFWYSTSIVNTAMVGHINNTPIYISAVVLSNIFTNVMGLTIAYGMCGGLATLGTQAFSAQNYNRVGNLLQRTICIQLLLAIPVCILWFGSAPLLVILGQNREVAVLAGHYIAVLSLGYLPSVLAEVLTNYLACQGVVLPVLPIQMAANVFNLVAAYVLVFHLHVGFLGAAWASVSSSYVAVGGFLLVLHIWPLQTWGGWSEKAFTQWGPLLRLSSNSALLMCAEWWLFEIVGFAAGYVGPSSAESLAVWGVMWQVMMCVLTVSLGLQVAMNTRIGSQLREGEPEAAQRSAHIGAGLGVVLAVVASVILFSFRHLIPIIWTRDEAVIERVAELLPLVCVFEAGHLLQVLLGGIVLGLGQQNIGSLAKIIGYYAIGLPLALILAFPAGLGIFGLLLGLCCATFSVCSLFAALILRSNWQLQSDLARNTARNSLSQFMLPTSEIWESEPANEQTHLLGRATL